MIQQTTYAVEILKSGQPRAYADTENEYRITVKRTQYGKDGLHPWVLHGDVEKRISEEEALRKAGKMYGGMSPDDLRKEQAKWARDLVRSLCQNFREKDDADGRTGMDAYFYPTLKWIKVDPKSGTVHAHIIEPFTD